MLENIVRDKDKITVEVTHRVLEKWSKTSDRVEDALLDVIYYEKQRLETDPMGTKEQQRYYNRLQSRVLKANLEEQTKLLKEVIERFVNEVHGHFDPRVYWMATRVVPTGLDMMLNTLSPIRLIEKILAKGGGLREQIVIEGHVDKLQALAKQGTIVLVPTHVSNLDSVLVGYALNELGLPPFLYGAGLNLFKNKLFGFFMHNLGAYKVDRRKKAAVYKDVLKTYAGVTMELGYHNLFFPGGTRSRSGGIEQKLKLGLLSMALDAYIHNLINNKERPDIFVIPCTINYNLVLEARTLIDDFLKAAGKSRYIIEDDESSKPKLVFKFVKKLFELQSRVHLIFGHPMDVFGNRVDEQGNSIDLKGRRINRERYVFVNGRPDFDPQRDSEYTKELSSAILRSYAENTVIKPVHLVSYAMIEMLKKANPEMDFYRLLRTGGMKQSFELRVFYKELEKLLEILKKAKLDGRLLLDYVLDSKDPPAILANALTHFMVDGPDVPAYRRGDRIFHNNRNLLLYYGNKLAMHPVMKEYENGQEV